MQSMWLRGISEHKSSKGFLFLYMHFPNLAFSSSFYVAMIGGTEFSNL